MQRTLGAAQLTSPGSDGGRCTLGPCVTGRSTCAFCNPTSGYGGRRRRPLMTREQCVLDHSGSEEGSRRVLFARRQRGII